MPTLPNTDSRPRPAARLDMRPLANSSFLAPAAIIIGGIACLVLNGGGHFSYDSVMQLAEGVTGVYSGAHPPVMSWFLGLAAGISPSAGIYVVLQVMLIAGALIAMITLGGRRGWPLVLLASCAIVTPQLLIYPSIVWKDVLFAGTLVAGFACLAHTGANWNRFVLRYGLLAVSALFLSVAALTRQNGAIALPFAAMAVGWMAWQGGGKKRLRSAVLLSFGFLASMVAIVGAASLALAEKTETDPSTSDPWRALAVYDIVNVLTLAPRTPLPVMHARAPVLEKALRTRGVALYSPVRADTLDPIFEAIDDDASVTPVIKAQWVELVAHYPLLYLRARARSFSWVFFTPDHDRCVLVYTGIDGAPEDMSAAGLRYRRNSRDEAIATYAFLFAPTPVYWHAAYAVLSLVMMAWLINRRRPADIAIAAMLASALAFAMSFAVISIACDYRYLYALDLATIAGLLYIASTRTPGSRRRLG